MRRTDAASAAVRALESAAEDDTREPLFTVTHGNPTAEELAALTAVFTAAQARDAAAGGTPDPVRRAQSRRMRLGMRLRPGRGAWRGTRPER